MRQVSELTGVPENTIRSWERRFGLPQPERSDGNQRRYTQRDAGIILAIQGARDRGRTMEQAIEDVAADPPAARFDDVVGDTQPPRTTLPMEIAPNAGGEVLVDSLLALDDERTGALLADQLWGSTVDVVCIDLLLPAWRTIDQRRASGSATDVQARFGQAWIERKLLSVLDLSNPDHGRRDIVVGAMHDRSGWLHALGYAILLSRAGYVVAWLGHNVSVADAKLAVAMRSPDALLLVGDSALSLAAVKAAVNDRSLKGTASWNGFLVTANRDADIAEDAASIPLHATHTVLEFERELCAWTTRRHGARNA